MTQRVGSWVLVVALAMMVRTLPASADIVMGYCCECTGCPSASTVECFSVGAKGFSGAADCTQLCSSQTMCQSSNFVEGTCEEHLVDCDPRPFHKAPAASHAILALIMTALAAYGFRAAQHRRVG